MSPPWMPLYVKDYLADTGHLTAAQHGCYMLLLMHQWQHGFIPEDDRALARICRSRPDEWTRHYKKVILDFFEATAGGYRQARAAHEAARSAEISSKRKAAALQMHSKRSANADTTTLTLTKDTITPIGARTNTGGVPAVGASHEDVLKDEKSTNVIVGNFDMVSPDGKFFITSTEIEALEAEFPTVKGIRDRVRNALRSWTVDIQPGRRKAAIHKHLINEMQKIAERHETRAAREAARVREKAVADALPKTHFQQMRELGFKAW